MVAQFSPPRKTAGRANVVMIRRRAQVGFLFALLVALAATAHADGGPLTIEDVRQLRRDGRRPHEIVQVAEQRGVAFPLDQANQRVLRAIGLRRRHIEKLGELYAAQDAEEDLGEGPRQRRDRALRELGGDAAAEDGQADGGAAGLPELSDDPRQRTLDSWVRQMIEASGVDLEMAEAGHARIIAPAKLARRYVKIAERWEEQAQRHFPSSMIPEVDRRGVNVVLFEERYQYESWVRAMFHVYEQNGVQFNNPDPVERAIKSKSFFVHGIFTGFVRDETPDGIRHRVAFACAYLGIQQLTNSSMPDALATGFGNLAETMLFNDQFITVQSGYRHREIDREAKTWSALVKEGFRLKQIGSVQNVFAYSTRSMQLPQYAQGWSLMTLLAQDEEKLARWVTLLADDEDPFEALSEAYATDDDALLQRWRRYARAQR
ncbi:MAG: hypothetical protein DWQ42_15450 [Planctomycetota bacterium]|nr:MAG: hypothetical protein DWQ42_15450 [Planctomycetota bacterium]REK47160.1 MAG: hypothetical protein DWQ46_04830 [Planctomycetota bacterium]